MKKEMPIKQIIDAARISSNPANRERLREYVRSLMHSDDKRVKAGRLEFLALQTKKSYSNVTTDLYRDKSVSEKQLVEYLDLILNNPDKFK